MVRKIAALLSVLMLAGCTLACAMFFDDNPRYIQVGHDDTTESYIDMNSIQSIRYDPPYYIIRAIVITYDYADNTAIGYDNKFFYNFKNQTVKAQTTATYRYTHQGLAMSPVSLPHAGINPCDRYSVNGKAADNAFFSCYNMTFYHTFTSSDKTEPKRELLDIPVTISQFQSLL